ncbi:unnamed protein product [Triticum turgidum subsp. durum]|uniref:Auxin-responsive protein n=1 Tax=Triticum turgidum subsp. durum TaxID=4567 RepID=A0A9R0Q3M6_TRITD|nr:unnamed protein product [Triticum turgidum subsp. durum]
MSVETERSSTESSAASGLDFEDTALTLRLPGSDPDRKRASTSDPDCPSPTAAASDSPPSPKAQVVGWPPVRSFRKNALAAAASSKTKFVKVAVDGAPYLRKVDLKAYAGYTSSASYDQLLATLQEAWERGDEARGRGERDGVCADVRGQGRRLDARRRRPLENVCGNLSAHSSHEKL